MTHNHEPAKQVARKMLAEASAEPGDAFTTAIRALTRALKELNAYRDAMPTVLVQHDHKGYPSEERPMTPEEAKRWIEKQDAQIAELEAGQAAYRTQAINRAWNHNLAQAYGREEYQRHLESEIDATHVNILAPAMDLGRGEGGDGDSRA